MEIRSLPRLFFRRHIVHTSILLFLFLLCGTFQVNARPTVALVLGGGSARGLSHVGLLKAFEEEGIPVDYIVGASMGSVIAGLYAAGLSADNLHYMVTEMNIAELFVPEIPPKGGLITTDRFEIFVNVLTDHARFETLPIPFHTLVLNLVTGEEVVLNTGSLSDGILASMAIPGMFPPVKIGDDYFVDGGMRTLIPVEVAKNLGADLVIAVDVRSEVPSIDHDAIASNLQLTLKLLLHLNSEEQLKLADIVIVPGVALESYMDYDRGDHFVHEGYRAAKASIEEIRIAILELDSGFNFDKAAERGYSTRDFAERMHLATAKVEEEVPGEFTVPELSFELSADRPRFEMGFSVPVGSVNDRIPVFANFASKSWAGGSAPSIGVGLGNCYKLCTSIFARRDGHHGDWLPGVALRGRIGGYARYEGEWARGGGAVSSWRIAAILPDVFNTPVKRRELWLSASRDEYGFYGQSDDRIHADIMYRRYFPYKRTDLWHVIQTSTDWFFGVGAHAVLFDKGVNWHPVGEAGIAFEARLFGLYPLRSHLSAIYSGGDLPWSLRWTIGK